MQFDIGLDRCAVRIGGPAMTVEVLGLGWGLILMPVSKYFSVGLRRRGGRGIVRGEGRWLEMGWGWKE